MRLYLQQDEKGFVEDNKRNYLEINMWSFYKCTLISGLLFNGLIIGTIMVIFAIIGLFVEMGVLN